jgi:single-stranded-DNA-specific exonuclease
VLRLRHNAGLRALSDVARIDAAPTCFTLGFILGPRINAGGRVGASGLGAKLLATDDADEARLLAARLDQLNTERKAIEERMLEEATARAEQALEAGACPYLWLDGDEWHQGLLGLVAGRVTDRFHLPTFAVSWDAGGAGVGSARSIATVDLGSVIRDAVHGKLLVKGGGHAMAAGFRLERHRLKGLLAFLAERLGRPVAAARAVRALAIDGALSSGGANKELMELIDKTGPYGQGHPEPRFAFPAHRVTRSRLLKGQHLCCTLIAANGARTEAVAFRAGDTPFAKLLLANDGAALHVAGHLRHDCWNGREGVELVIDDAAPATTHG